MRAKFVLFLLFCLATPLPFAATPARSSKAAPKADASFVRAAPLPKWAQALAEIPPSKRDDTVVVRLAESQAWTGPGPAVLRNTAVQVNGKSALDSIGQFGISYVPAYQKLLLHRVALLRGKDVIDRTAVVNTRLLQRETGLESNMYGGATTVQLLLEDVQVGDTLWLTYTIEGSNPVFGNMWSDLFAWDSTSPVESRKLTILHPKNRPLQWRALGEFKTNEVKPVIDTVGANERLVFSEQAIEALDEEVSTPSDYISHRSLQFSEFGKWQEVATWASGLFTPLPPSPATTALVRKFGQEGDQLAQASAALHWVQDEIRYFSVSMGENSHRPQLPDVVLKRRYGDCKDKSYLLVSLLRQLGIKATPVLVSAQAPAFPGKLLPTPAQFDHVIVQVDIDGKRYNVDPTRNGERGLLPILPPAIAGAQGLLVDSATDALIKLAESTQTEPELERFETIKVDALDSDGTLELRRIYRGRYAQFARLSLPAMSGAELRKTVLAMYEKRYPGVTIAATPTLKESVDGASFELLAKLKLNKPVEHKDGTYRIDFESQIVNDTLDIPSKLIRNFPFALPLGRFHGRYRLDIQWPETVRADAGSSPSMIDTPFFTLKEDYGLRGNRFRYEVDYALKRSAIAAAELPELQVQAKAMVEKLKVQALVGEGDLVLPAGMSSTMRNLELARTGLLVRAFREAYAKAKFEEVPITEICDFLINTYTLDTSENKRGLLDIRDGLFKSQAARPGYTLCGARFKFAIGDFVGSIPMFTAAATSTEPEPYTNLLAWARYYSETDAAGAERDIRRYYEERKRKGVVSGYDAAETVALLQRLGAGVPPELDGASLASAAWPYPIVAMQLGALSVDALQAQIDAMPNDERELAANDAKFYVAQKYIVQGKRQLAIDTLRWYPPHGMRTSRIGQQAVAELWRQTHDDPDLKTGLTAELAGDAGKAMRHYKIAAERGSPVGQYNLGQGYYFGIGTAKNVITAAHWFTSAAAQGVPGAMNFLGMMYEDGDGVPQDGKRAIQWLEAGARFGDRHASSNLGERYMWGTGGLKQDYAKAFPHLRLGAEMGNAKAQSKLSYLYVAGKGTAQDYGLAAFWSGLSLGSREPDAMLTMGILKRNGFAMEKDPVQAIKLFEACAEINWHSCVYQLGLAYEAGDGVKPDPATAQSFFERAATEGNAAAQLLVGQRMLANKGDLSKARNWLLKAARGGEEKAFELLGEMVEASRKSQPDIDLVEQLADIRHFSTSSAFSYREAANWYRVGMELGSNLAINNLGDFYENGFGVEKEIGKAVALYRRSAANGYGFAFYSLGSLYDKGLGVPANPRLAFVYYEIASRNGVKLAESARTVAGKKLSDPERRSAEALAAAWRPSQPLPME